MAESAKGVSPYFVKNELDMFGYNNDQNMFMKAPRYNSIDRVYILNWLLLTSCSHLPIACQASAVENLRCTCNQFTIPLTYAELVSVSYSTIAESLNLYLNSLTMCTKKPETHRLNSAVPANSSIATRREATYRPLETIELQTPTRRQTGLTHINLIPRNS